MSLGDFLLGNKRSIDKLPTMGAGQQQIQNQMTQGIGGTGGGMQATLAALMEMITGGGADGMMQQAQQQFETQTLPGIAERFAGGGALSSSGFGQALGGASADFGAQMAGLQSQRQQSGIQGMMGLNQQAMGQDEFAYLENPASAGAMAPMLSMLMKVLMGGV